MAFSFFFSVMKILASYSLIWQVYLNALKTKSLISLLLVLVSIGWAIKQVVNVIQVIFVSFLLLPSILFLLLPKLLFLWGQFFELIYKLRLLKYFHGAAVVYMYNCSMQVGHCKLFFDQIKTSLVKGAYKILN